MFENNLINDLSNKIRDLLDKSPLSDLDKNIHALIQGAFTKMELISREEYDIQTEVLKNARAQLNALEKKCTELEALLKNANK